MSTKYNYKNNTFKYLKYNVKNDYFFEYSKGMYLSVIDHLPNGIAIDAYFYSKANDIKLDNNIYRHINQVGVPTGLLYHGKQVDNLFPKASLIEKNDDIYVEYNNQKVKLSSS